MFQTYLTLRTLVQLLYNAVAELRRLGIDPNKIGLPLVIIWHMVIVGTGAGVTDIVTGDTAAGDRRCLSPLLPQVLAVLRFLVLLISTPNTNPVSFTGGRLMRIPNSKTDMKGILLGMVVELIKTVLTRSTTGEELTLPQLILATLTLVLLVLLAVLLVLV